jgi:hypothetical protein
LNTPNLTIQELVPLIHQWAKEREIYEELTPFDELLKAEGVLSGVADLVVLLPQGKSLYIEMKVKGNRQTQNQKDFQKKVIALEHTYAVCYTFEEFKQIIENLITKP